MLFGRWCTVLEEDRSLFGSSFKFKRVARYFPHARTRRTLADDRQTNMASVLDSIVWSIQTPMEAIGGAFPFYILQDYYVIYPNDLTVRGRAVRLHLAFGGSNAILDCVLLILSHVCITHWIVASQLSLAGRTRCQLETIKWGKGVDSSSSMFMCVCMTVNFTYVTAVKTAAAAAAGCTLEKTFP